MIIRIEDLNLYKRNEYNVYRMDSEENIQLDIGSNGAKTDFSLKIGDGPYLKYFHSFFKNPYFKGFLNRLSAIAILDENSNHIGSILPKTSTNKGLKYFYNEVEYYGEKYYIYDIGMGSEGRFLMMYDSFDRVVAAVEKDNVVYMNRDTYTLYSEETHKKEIPNILLAYTITLDAAQAENASEDLASKSTDCYYTVQKALKEKYDPDFIKRVKAKQENQAND